MLDIGLQGVGRQVIEMAATIERQLLEIERLTELCNNLKASLDNSEARVVELEDAAKG